MRQPSTDCDIKLTGELKMRMLDAGITSEAFYWTAQGKVALVAVAGRTKVLALADTPVQAIEQGARKIYGGL